MSELLSQLLAKNPRQQTKGRLVGYLSITWNVNWLQNFNEVAERQREIDKQPSKRGHNAEFDM